MFTGPAQSRQNGVAVVMRDALVTSIIHDGSAPCTLIIAPSGYGKSILLGQLNERLASTGNRVTSVSLDEWEASPEQFVSRLRRLWDNEAPGDSGDEGEHALIEAGGDRRAAQALCDLWGRDGRNTVVILDDFHKADSARVGRFAATLIEALPINIHIVIAARRIRQLPVARLRAKGLIREIGTEDLRFLESETREMLPTLDDFELAKSEVGGWPILVQLLALAGKIDERHPTAKEILDRIEADLDNFFETEILPDIPDITRQMLLDTAAVDELEPELANALSGRLDCGFLLRHLGELSLCRPEVSATATTFLKQPGFSRFWRNRLLALRGEQGVMEQRRRAADWLLEHGRIRAAAHQLAQTQDYRAVAKIVEDRGAVRIALIHGFPELTKLLSLLPSEVLSNYPRLMIARAWVSAKAGNTQDARYWYERAAHGTGTILPSDQFRSEALFVDRMIWTVYEQHPISPEEIRKIEEQLPQEPNGDPWFSGWINNLLCIMHTRRGELGRAEEFAQQAIESYRSAGSIYGEIFMHLHLALVGVIGGRLTGAAHAAEYACDLASRHFPDDPGLLGITDFLRGRIAYEQYEVDKARALLQRGMAKLDHAETWVEVYALGTSALAKLTAAAGDFDNALAYLDITRSVGVSRALPRLIWSAECCKCELLMLTDQMDAARESMRIADTIAETASDEDFCTWFEKDRAAIARFRLSISHQEPMKIIGDISLFADDVRSQGRYAALVEAHILIAEIYFCAGNAEDAVNSFLEAVKLAAKSRMFRPFIEEGEAITPIVKRLIRTLGISAIDGTALPFILETLATLKPVSFGRSSASVIFSDKELEVLSLLLDNHPNKTIARRMNVSEATVKFHLIKIYQKLGVTKRSEAKAVAQERQLIKA